MFDTKSSCLTYNFKTDNLGFKSVEQIRQLPFKDAVGIDHDYKYTGKLFVPQESVPSNMIVRFPLRNGSVHYLSSQNLLFYPTEICHRRSCCHRKDVKLSS